METHNIPLHEQPLEKLVADHTNLKKSLGPDHFLVQQLWTEIRKRNEKETIKADAGTDSVQSAINTNGRVSEATG
jgi:hypothetical protein